jgi:hypothetical protein
LSVLVERLALWTELNTAQETMAEHHELDLITELAAVVVQVALPARVEIVMVIRAVLVVALVGGLLLLPLAVVLLPIKEMSEE